MDFSKELRIKVNRKQRFKGRVTPDWEFALQEMLNRRDGSPAYLAKVVIDLSK